MYAIKIILAGLSYDVADALQLHQQLLLLGVFILVLIVGSNAGGGYGGTLDTLVRGLLPAHLRVGGTQGDYDVYTGFASEKGTTGYFPVGSACGDLPSPMTDYRCRVRVCMLCVVWFVLFVVYSTT